MRTMKSRLRSLALLCLLASLGRGDPAGAVLTTFELETGNLNSGSGVAFGGNAIMGLYSEGSEIPVDVTITGPSTATLDFDLSDVGIPDAVEFLSGTRFEFTVLPNGHFTLFLDLDTGEINEDLLDPKVSVFISKFAPGGFTPVAQTTAQMDFSTGIQDPPGGCNGTDRSGAPIDPNTGDVTLRGIACVAQIGSGSNMLLDVKLTGTLPIEAPEVSFGDANAIALVSLAALVRARRGRVWPNA